MSFKALTKQEVEHFMERGWVRVEEAFSRKDALNAQEFLWKKLEERGFSRTDQTTWPNEKYTIEETYNTPEFQACNTDRLLDAIDDLVGEGRTIASRSADVSWGWWQINFAAGANRPWDVPKGGWHYDGIHFRHYVDSPEQGLLLLCLFNDVTSKAGGTLAVEGSHHLVARVLKDYPEGLDIGQSNQLARKHPYMVKLTGADQSKSERTTNDIYAKEEETSSEGENRIEYFMNNTYHDPEGYSMRVVETTGGAGDAILCHPFLIHAPSQNVLRVPRFMCNRTTPLKERMNLNRSDVNDYSPLELSIVRSVYTERAYASTDRR